MKPVRHPVRTIVFSVAAVFLLCLGGCHQGGTQATTTPEADTQPAGQNPPQAETPEDAQASAVYLDGQIIPDPDHAGQCVRFDPRGNRKPVFFCGPGDPEGFLYRDDQEAILQAMAGTGANCLYVQMVRSHGGDGEADHNPFLDHDPQKGLDAAILKTWKGWFERMNRQGIVLYLFLYDDSASPFGGGDRLPEAEKAFLREIVQAFADQPNIIWCVAEEYSEKLSKARVRAIAQEIRRQDPHDHIIAVHQLNGLSFDFADAESIEQFAIQWNGPAGKELHDDLVKARSQADGRYSLVCAENIVTRSQLAEEDRAGLRRDSWACAMAGLPYMWLGAWEDPHGAPSQDMLRDAGRVVEFMKSTDYHRMAPRDHRAAGDTRYVLAGPEGQCILYGIDGTDGLGIKGMQAGSWTLHWQDCTTGKTVEQTRPLSAGDHVFPRPDSIGPEAVVYIRPGEPTK